MKQIFSSTKTKPSGTTTVTQYTYSIRKIILFITILMAINSVTAFTISLNSPDSVNINEEFYVKIKAETDETHDVKVFVHKSDEENIPRGDYISEIYEDSWQDPWYYIKEIFPDEKEFKIKVTTSTGNRKICARLRNSETKSTVTECNSIKVKDEENREDEEIKEKPVEQEIEQLSAKPENQNPSKIEEKIILNSPQQQPQVPSKESFITKAENTRLKIIYAFTFLCIIIISLLALKKL